MDDPGSMALDANAEPRQINRNASTSSSISKLNHDILMEIFLMNASMDEDPQEDGKGITRNPPQRAIDITRICSQVSFQWRTIIVNTGWLWSKLIDLDVLDISGSNWRNEVSRRTKEVPLHVKGSIDPGPCKTMDEPWWFGFLNAQWKRIRVFDVSVVSKGAHTFRDFDMDYNKTDEFQNALPFLVRSTTILESFRLNLRGPCDPLGPDSSLFGDDAPRLRSFQIQHWPINLMKKYSWVPQLHNLSILEYYGRTFATVDDLCQLLSQIPHLRSLYLTDAIDSPDGVLLVTSPKRRVAVRLPSLDRIELRSTDLGLNASRNGCRAPAIYWRLLGSIVPKPGCSVRVLTSDIINDIPDIDNIILLRYAKHYFTINRPQKLRLTSGKGWFRLTDLPCPAYARDFLTAFEGQPMSLSDMPFFDFDLMTQEESYWEELLGGSSRDKMYELLTSLFSLTFPSVIELDLELGFSHRAAFINPGFRNLLSSFSSVQNISIEHPTLHLLNTSPVIDITTLFPQLRILSTSLHHTSTHEYDSLPPPQGVVTSFLRPRKNAGLPLAIFECKPRILMDLTFLDEFTGMTVVWKTKSLGTEEYICGSGKPQELNFEEKFRFAEPKDLFDEPERPMLRLLVGSFI